MTKNNSDRVVLPEVDMGLHVIRWKTEGFREMRRLELLSRKSRFELVDGLIVHRGCGSTRHDNVVAELVDRLTTAHATDLIRVADDAELTFGQLDSIVSPDVVVFDPDDEPALIVEVSHDAPRLEAMEKATLYARAGIPLYWHIDLAWRHLQVHSSPYPDGTYGSRLSGPPDRALLTWHPALPELTLDELVAAAGAR